MPGKNKIYLTGFMGSGKTTAGKKLADCLGWSFIDLDKVIEEHCRMTIPQIFTEYGEAYFRKVEAEALTNFKDHHEIVIATGGGSPCYSGNMDHMLENGIVIYLKLTPVQLLNRLEGSQDERPLLKDLSYDQLLSYIEKKLDEREPFYNRAHIIADGYLQDIYRICSDVKKITEDISLKE
jgi:shikimate kinase